MATQTKYDEHGMTATQKNLLELVERGAWFDPEDYAPIRHIGTRISVCKQLADKGILLKRPFSDLGYLTFQYMFPRSKASEMGITRKVSGE